MRARQEAAPPLAERLLCPSPWDHPAVCVCVCEHPSGAEPICSPSIAITRSRPLVDCFFRYHPISANETHRLSARGAALGLRGATRGRRSWRASLSPQRQDKLECQLLFKSARRPPLARCLELIETNCEPENDDKHRVCTQLQQARGSYSSPGRPFRPRKRPFKCVSPKWSRPVAQLLLLLLLPAARLPAV